jgi:hypothetical protein
MEGITMNLGITAAYSAFGSAERSCGFLSHFSTSWMRFSRVCASA